MKPCDERSFPVQNDADDRLHTYEGPFREKSRARSLRFLFPRLGLILLTALITLAIAVQSAYGCQGNGNNGGGNNGGGNNNSKANNKVDNGVGGSVGFSVQKTKLNLVNASPGSPGAPGNAAANLTIKLNLQNVPLGLHKADIHQGTCPLVFTLNGQPAPFGPFTPGVTLPLGLVQAKADGTLKQTLKFQVGGTTGIPVNFLQTGKWFFCIHTGTLAQVTGTTPAQKFASLQKFLATPNGPGQVKQLVCQPLNAAQGKNSLTLSFQGGQNSSTN